jgi:hypothetical protein
MLQSGAAPPTSIFVDSGIRFAHIVLAGTRGGYRLAPLFGALSTGRQEAGCIVYNFISVPRFRLGSILEYKRAEWFSHRAVTVA